MLSEEATVISLLLPLSIMVCPYRKGLAPLGANVFKSGTSFERTLSSQEEPRKS